MQLHRNGILLVVVLPLTFKLQIICHLSVSYYAIHALIIKTVYISDDVCLRFAFILQKVGTKDRRFLNEPQIMF